VNGPRMDMTLAELQEMAARQQQQIEAQQLMLATKEQRLKYLKQQDQRQQQASEQEKLKRLREIAENQEAKLKKVRALKGHVEQKRLSNGRLMEEIEQMNNVFQQKQKELMVAVAKVEDLNRQLEMLKNGRIEGYHDNQSAVAELDRLYKELQLRNKLNQEQNAKLQQQRESLNKRNSEVTAMDKRVNELRDRLWKKKVALQQKENVPISSDGNLPQQVAPTGSRVAAVGPYIQSATMPLYGKPVIGGAAAQNQQNGSLQIDGTLVDGQKSSSPEPDSETPAASSENQETERIPRPLSPTKLLPFLSNPYRNQSDADLEALRRKLYNAPRPLKKRSSITEPEGPNGPNIQKLLYQRTTLAAMETISAPKQTPVTPISESSAETQGLQVSTDVQEEPPSEDSSSLHVLDIPQPEDVSMFTEDIDIPSPELGPDSIPEGIPFPGLTSPAEVEVNQDTVQPPDTYVEEYPPYPPPPYPTGGDPENLVEEINMHPPEITEQFSLPPVSITRLTLGQICKAELQLNLGRQNVIENLSNWWKL
ncbi:hypothetical protein AB205_0190740, partial [Aquarana catesbeiana]